MKKDKFSVLRMLAMVLTLGGIFVGCDNGNGGYTEPGTAGKLTIIGFEEYNDRYAVALCNDYALEKSFLAGAGFNEDGSLVDAVKISNGQATLKVWEIKNRNALSYNGNDTLAFRVLIYEHTPVVYNNGFDDQYLTFKDVTGEFTNGVASGEMYIPSTQTNLSDTRFNGTFKSGSYTWVFDGTNKAKYTIVSSASDQEVKLKDGHLWRRQWNNKYSVWKDEGSYSFSQDGKSLTVGYYTFTLQD